MKNEDQTLIISKSGSRTSEAGLTAYFTGGVRVESLFSAHAPARTAGARVTFERGARSAWHSHPLGQILMVTAGRGFVQTWGGPVRTISEGDVIWTPPGVKHWHGASPTASMTHLAIQEALDGKMVEWMEKVTDAEYAAASR